MPRTHKDLPGGSQDWAAEVDKGLAKIAQLEAVIRRLAENAGLDMSNPSRGVNVGDTPSIKNPVGQKLSSLADVSTYNVLDGQSLTWNQAGQKWLPVTPTSGGMEMRPATVEEKLEGELVIDGTYESASVFGYQGNPDPTHSVSGTGDSYGLVGTSDASAYLHAAGRFFGGSQKFHSYVGVHPYYVHMKSMVIEETTGAWTPLGGIEVGRNDVYITTPKYQYYSEDGLIKMDTNWFFVPLFTTADRPTPTSFPANYKGAHIYDTTLNIPIWWDGSQWTNALGTAV